MRSKKGWAEARDLGFIRAVKGFGTDAAKNKTTTGIHVVDAQTIINEAGPKKLADGWGSEAYSAKFSRSNKIGVHLGIRTNPHSQKPLLVKQLQLVPVVGLEQEK